MVEFDTYGAGPTVLVLHGGGWGTGHRREMAAICAEIARAGSRAVAGSYRFAPHHKWPAQHEDVLRLVEAHRPVAALGFSAGAHLASWLGVEARVQAVVGIAGIYDLEIPLTPAGEEYGIVSRLLTIDTPEERRFASPVHHVGTRTAPHFLIHGEEDPLVPVSHSFAMAEELGRRGLSVRFRLVPSMGHGLLPTRMGDRHALDEALAWLRGLGVGS
jgi:acetyl esterase/lipase